MTKGRPSIKALEIATGMAKSRGRLWEAPAKAGLPFDFIIFSGFCTWFVKVRRTRSNVSAPPELLLLCTAAIRGLRQMPGSEVSARELWTLSPHGTWQFFRIADDAVMELRSDGTIMSGTGTSSPDPHLQPAGSGVPVPGQSLPPSPPGSVICPYLSSALGRTRDLL